MNIMQQEILKPEYFLKKTQWQRKTYPLKLNLDATQLSQIDVLVMEYKKAINKAIQIITKDVFANFEEIKEIGDIKNDKCPFFKKTKNLN